MTLGAGAAGVTVSAIDGFGGGIAAFASVATVGTVLIGLAVKKFRDRLPVRRRLKPEL